MLEDVGLRRGLPLGCLNYMGRHNSNTVSIGHVVYVGLMCHVMAVG